MGTAEQEDPLKETLEGLLPLVGGGPDQGTVPVSIPRSIEEVRIPRPPRLPQAPLLYPL